MSANILAPLDGNIKLEKIMADLEEIAAPGMRVIFLSPYVPCLFDGFDEWLKEQTHSVRSQIETPTQARQKMEAYAKTKQKQLTWERLSPVREALSKKGIEVAVEVYEGSLKRKLREYSADRQLRDKLHPQSQQIKRRCFLPRGVILATVSFLTLVAVWLVPLTASAQQKEYKTTAPRTVLLQGELAAFKGKEANIMSLDLPPGWVGGRHYHTGDVFVYVQEGAFAVDIDGEGRKTFSAGQVYQEALKKVMQARNPSSTKPAKIIVFQVNDQGQPLMIKAN